jgi:phospholipase C
MPKQEPGVRPATSIPYQLYAEGELSEDRKSFGLKLQPQTEVFGSRSAGAPFKVYAPGNYRASSGNVAQHSFEAARSWDYAVKAGDTLRDNWPLESFEGRHYHLRVYGPNGFFREFMGNAKDPEIGIVCEYERNRLFKNKLTGNIALKISNHNTDHSYHVVIKDHSYKNNPVSGTIAAGEEITVVLDLKRSFHWYDFTVEVKGTPGFAKRYAGHVETGEESCSDPAMGRSI